MKFTVEIEDEDQSISSIQYKVASNIAYEIIKKIDIEKIKAKALEETEAIKKKILDGFKNEMKSWDKFDIVMEANKTFGGNWKQEISKEIIAQLRADSTFVSKVSTEIIKTKFSKD